MKRSELHVAIVEAMDRVKLCDAGCRARNLGGRWAM